LPGRDRVSFLDGFGLIVIIGAIVGVIGHAILRRYLGRKCFFEEESNQ